MTTDLKRRKVEDGLYEVTDQTGAVVATIWEGGKSGYRWTVSPTDRSIRGWDSETLSGAIDGLSRTLEARR